MPNATRTPVPPHLEWCLSNGDTALAISPCGSLHTAALDSVNLVSFPTRGTALTFRNFLLTTAHHRLAADFTPRLLQTN